MKNTSGLTHYNSAPASSSRHETHSASFCFLWYTWKKKKNLFYLFHFNFSSSSASLFLSPFSGLLPLIFSPYTIFFTPPPIPPVFSSLAAKSTDYSECQWHDNGVFVVALLNTVMLMLDPLSSSVCLTNIFLPTHTYFRILILLVFYFVLCCSY